MTQNTYHQSRGHDRARQQQEDSRIDANLLKKISFSTLSADIFSDIAEEVAKQVKGDRDNNKRTQLRRFYDELVQWNDTVQQAGDSEQRQAKYADLEPFVKMLKAKVVYAKGRNHVDLTFEKLFSHCIGEINSPESLKRCKLFMEAFMGFYRALDK